MEDDGYPRGLEAAPLANSLVTLGRMAAEAGAAAAVVRTLAGASARKCAIVRVHRLCGPDIQYTDLRVAGARPESCNRASRLVCVACEGTYGRRPCDVNSSTNCANHVRFEWVATLLWRCKLPPRISGLNPTLVMASAP